MSKRQLFELGPAKRYDVEPVAKPRMTRADKWRRPPRPEVARYRRFCDQIRLKRVQLPMPYKVTFFLPLADGHDDWDGRIHEEVPDKDNLEKALLDAIYKDDRKVWSGWPEKRWTKETRGFFTVQRLEEVELWQD